MSNIPSSLPSGLPPPLKITTTPLGGGNSNRRRGSLFREPLPATFRPTQQQQQQQHRSATARRNSIADVFLSGEDLVRNLGSDYEEVQKRTLTSWANAKLSTLGDHINSIETDLKDGKRLLKLLSVVSGQSAPKPERMNMRIHQLANVAQALEFLQKLVRPDSLPDIGNEAIVNGDVKKTLALIFYIMLKFQIQVILGDHGENYMESIARLSERPSASTFSTSPPADTIINESPLPPTTPRSRRRSIANPSEKGLHSASEAKIALLYWVRIQLEDYTAANIISQIQDFSRSWRTGLAFCLLLHRYDPVLIPDLLTNHINNDLSSKETWRTLLTTAFDVAALQLNIPPYLDPEDLIDVEHPHEPSVMMYVSEYYKVMSVAQRQESDHSRRAKTSKRRAAIAIAAGENDGLAEELHHSPASLIFMDEPESLEDISEDPEEEIVIEDHTIKNPNSPAVAPSPTPLEAPVPIPMPSNRPRHQRGLSLAENDKAWIQQNIDSRLITQLTGHLPRGVHPELDQLLSIHDKVIEFIKTYAQAIDRIPVVFSRSDSVAEAIGMVETIEEKIPTHKEQLALAKEAYDTLVVSPENSIIHLTQLQRNHVTQLYQVSITAWQDFEELVKVTKADLERVEMDVVGAEDAIRGFKEHAAIVEAQMVALGKSVRKKEQPTLDFEWLDQYDRDSHNAMVQFQAFEESGWTTYCSIVRSLGQAGRSSVAHHIDLVQKVYDGLKEAVHKAIHNGQLFRQGMAFQKILDTLDKDIADVQALMEAGNMDQQKKPVTDKAISILEDRLGSIKARLQGVREEYDELLGEPFLGFSDAFGQVQNRYRIVGDWVDQIRVWFIEAGRIGKWIELRIQLLETRNQESAKIDPFELDFQLVKLAEVSKTASLEHERLKREVEAFDSDDMTRLRNHVKKLTLADESAGQRKLSPADASTIEITLATLNRLHKLQKLIHQRSEFVGIMVLRVEWEQMFNEARAWIEKTHRETSEFMNGGKARYRPGTRAEEVIASLVALEEKITEFDQANYAAVLEKYQEMEDLRELPVHMEARQSTFEDSFADLMKRRVFCRMVVEQYLAVADVVGQFESLLDQGELLLHDDNRTANVESLQEFKDTSAHLITEVVPHMIPYPDNVPQTAMITEDTQFNNEGNAAIRDLVTDYGMQIAVIADQLEQIIVDRRQNMSLQERASLVYDEIIRVTAWIEGRMASLVSPLEMVDKKANADVEELSRIEHERAGLENRVKQMDYTSLIDRARTVETDIMEANPTVIDRTEFLDAVEKLRNTYQKILSTLDRHKSELSVCRTFAAWQTQWDETDRAILDIAHLLWELTVKKIMFDPAREDETKSTMAEVEVQKQALHDIIMRKDQITSERFPETVRRYNALVEERTSLCIAEGDLPPILPTRYQELQGKHDEMKNLFEYAIQVMHQREAIVGWLEKVSYATEQGRMLCDWLGKAQGQRIGQQYQCDVTDPELQVNEFKRAVHQLQDVAAELNEYEPKDPVDIGDQLQWDFDVIDPYEYHTRIQRQIHAFLYAKKYELDQAEDQVDNLHRLVQDAGKTKEALDLYNAQISEARGWISERINQEWHQPIDTFSDLSEPRVIERQREQRRLVDEIAQFEESRLQPLRGAILDLGTSDQLQHQDSVASLQRNLGEVLLDLDELKKLLAEQAAAAAAALKRNHWGQQYTLAMSQIKTLNEQLRQLTKERDGTATDLVETRITDWYQQTKQLRQELDAFTQDSLVAVHAAYRAYEAALGQLSENSIPAHIEAMMDTLSRFQRRASEEIVSQTRDLSLIQQRIDWEQAVDHVLKQMTEQGHVLEEYIQHQARWYPETRNHLSVEHLKDQYQTHLNRFESFQRYTLIPLMNQIEWHSIASSVQKAEALEKRESSLRRLFVFAKEVMCQQVFVTSFLSEARELEQDADTIREILLKSAPDDLALARVQDFKKQVDNMLHRQAQAALYPERENADDDFQAKVHIQDKLANEIVRDIISTRGGVLSALAQALDEQLSSKQQQSLCELLFSRHAKHAVVCDIWIEKQKQHLEKYEQLLQKGSTQPLALTELEDALSAINGLSNAMQKGRDSVLSVLESFYEQGAAVLKTLDDEKLNSEFHQMSKTRDRIQDASLLLLRETGQLLTTFGLVLEPTETYYRAGKLVSDLAIIEHSIGQLDRTSLTDDQISQWQKRLDALDTGTCYQIQHMLQAMMAKDKDCNCLMQVPLKATQQQVDTASSMIVTVRATLSVLYGTISLNRLRKSYVDDAKALIQTMAAIQLSFKDARVRFKYVTFEEHSHQRQQLLSIQRDTQIQISDCKDAYKDLCERYDIIHANIGLGDEVVQLQKKVFDQWSIVQAEQEQFLRLMTRTGRWIDQYGTAGKLQQSLSMVQRDLQDDRRVANFSNNIKTSNQKRRHSLSSNNSSSSTHGEATLLSNLDNRVAAVSRNLNGLLAYARNQQVHDPDNSRQFIQFCDGVSARARSLQSTVVVRRSDLDKAFLMAQYQEELKRQCGACEEKIQYIKQQITLNQSVAEKKRGSVQTVVQTYGTALAGIRHMQYRTKESLRNGTLAEQANTLVDTFRVLRSETDRLKRPLEKALADLEQRLNVEEAYVAVLKSVSRHADAEVDLMVMLSTFNNLVSKVSKNARVTRATTKGDSTADSQDFANFLRRYKAMGAAAQEFTSAGNRIKTSLHKGRTIGGSRIEAITRAIDRRQDGVERKWMRIKVSADETQARFLEAQARTHAGAKFGEVTRYVRELQHRVNMLQLSGKSVALEQQELRDVQEEMRTVLSKRLKDTDALAAGVLDKDGQIKWQKHELTALVYDLEKLVQARQEQAQMEINIAMLLGMIDKADDEIAELSGLVERCAPHHARLVENRFEKEDLQSMLQRLNNGYRELEPRVIELIGKAKEEARKQFVDTHERVATKLDRTLTQWERAQSETTARKNELQTCLNQLDHDFFTKLAMAKSTSTRTSSSMNNRLPMPVPTLSSSQRHRKSRGGFRSSTASVNNKVAGRRATLSHSGGRAVGKSALNYIVTDPKSELDLQLGRIANESSYRMKIRMVPGEVGKYWFGDEQPRLMYCRILPSKMVMVRVGGGWEELSQFLKSHGHLYLSDQSDTSSAGDPSPPNSVRSDSPGASTNSEIKLRGRGNRSPPTASLVSLRSSSSTHTAGDGYVKGDRYIQVDEDMNQVTSVKLMKANDRSRRSPSKRQSTVDIL